MKIKLGFTQLFSLLVLSVFTASAFILSITGLQLQTETGFTYSALNGWFVSDISSFTALATSFLAIIAYVVMSKANVFTNTNGKSRVSFWLSMIAIYGAWVIGFVGVYSDVAVQLLTYVR